MDNIVARSSMVFTAGAIGGFLNRIVVWVFGYSGINEALGVTFAPAWQEQFIYTGVVWGGIWGIIFLLPFLRGSVLLRGLLYSIPPSLVMLFIVFPYWLAAGMMGVKLGNMIIPLVFLFNVVWGVAAALWLRLIGRDI